MGISGMKLVLVVMGEGGGWKRIGKGGGGGIVLGGCGRIGGRLVGAVDGYEGLIIVVNVVGS